MGSRLGVVIHRKVVVEGAARHAERLGCEPKQLCAALLVLIFQSDLVDSVLDGDSPSEIMPASEVNAGRWPMGERMSAVLDALRHLANDAGEVQISLRAFADQMQVSPADICHHINRLIDRGVITQVSRGTRGVPSVYRIVDGEAA